MKAIFLLFDSLNRHALSCYGGSMPTPNFDRLAERGTVFDRHFIGSMPCMPARRDMHTGRLNFLHRSWGPLEPFDLSFPRILSEHGVYTHLVSDHYHYFENGGATYHTAYTSWEFIRGQEADPWVAMVEPPLERYRQAFHADQFEDDRNGYRLQNMVNRERIRETGDFPAVKCFDAALEFLDRNGRADGWLLQVETFDPHEPFHAPAEFRSRFPAGYQGPVIDWPRYRRAGGESDAETAELQANYAALVALCDHQLGRLLDEMDRLDLWRDTALVLTTDHGFLLGEHEWWGKNRMPFYNEIAMIPLMVHLPGAAGGTRSAALSQNIDVMATLLDLFGIAPPDGVIGSSLLPAPHGRPCGRKIALYGIFGGAINATDGRYTYFRYPEDMERAPLFEYTLMPQHARLPFSREELRLGELHHGFRFTGGVPVLKIPALPQAKRPPMQGGGFADTRTALYDLDSDPSQSRPIDDPDVERRMVDAIIGQMRIHQAPTELFGRFDLPRE